MNASLTEEIAKAFRNDPYSSDLSTFAFIEDVASQVLGGYEGDLNLKGLISLSDASAKALALHQGDLNLNGLTSLSDASAKALARHRGDRLTLNGLTSLSDTAARALSQHAGGQLECEGLKSLSDSAAKALALYQGRFLLLNGLTSLSDAAAKGLARRKGILELNGLTSLSHSAAKALAQITLRPDQKEDGMDFGLVLNGLTSLGDAAAAALALHQGDFLLLNGLTSLSDAAAKALARHKGKLELNGLGSLSDAAAKALGGHKGELYLNGLTSLSDAAVEAVAGHEGDLWLHGLTSISDDGSRALFGRSGGLFLDGLTSLSDAAAKAIGEKSGEYFLVNLNGLTSLSDAAAKAMGALKGQLNLNGLMNLSDASAEALGGHEGNLCLNGLTSLSDAAAMSLARHGSREWTQRFGEISIRYTGSLDLNGLGSLSDAAAKALGGHRGELNLNGLTSLSDTAAQTLGGHEGRLCLNGLTSLSDHAAEGLGRRRGAELEWKIFARQNLLREVTLAARVKAEVEARMRADESAPFKAPGIHPRGSSPVSETAPAILTEEIARRFLAGDEIDLSRFSRIETEAAAVLAKYPQELFLDGLTNLSVATAALLGEHTGDLHLNGLTRLSPATAAFLGRRLKPRDRIYLNGLSCVGDGVAAGLAGRARVVDGDLRSFSFNPFGRDRTIELRSVQDIDAVDALNLISSFYSVSLGLKNLNDIIALNLGQHQGKLFLNSLENLTESAARCLFCSFRQKDHWQLRVSLNGLKSLSNELAAAICEPPESSDASKGPSPHLSLDGLTSLGDGAAASLGKLKNTVLSLNGLTDLSDGVAAYLAKMEGHSKLSLRGLTSVSKVAAAELLRYERDHSGFLEIDFSWLTTISDDIARMFRVYGANRRLNGLTSLSVPAAEGLVADKYRHDHYHPHGIQLNGLKSLCAEVAEVFGRMDCGSVYFNGLREISPEAAAALSRTRAVIHLGGLTNLPEEVAATLGKVREVHLNGVTHLCRESAAGLMRQGQLRAGEGESLRDFRSRCGHNTRTLGLTSLSAEVAEVLAESSVDLFFTQLSHLSDDAAAALAKHDGRLGFYKLTDHLSATAAAALARHKFNYTEKLEYDHHAYVFVEDAYKLSPKVAKALGKHKNSPHPPEYL